MPSGHPRGAAGRAGAGSAAGRPRKDENRPRRPRAVGGAGLSDAERSGLYKAVYNRRDVRARFTKRPVEDSTLARILDAAHHAPSVGFSQPWDFIIVKGTAARGKIKASFDAEREAAARALDGDPDRRLRYLSLKLEGILDAPVNVCVTYDRSRFGPFVIGRGSIPETGVYSVCCAVQNLWLAARAEGVGVGWVSILSNDAVRGALRIPPHVLPVAYLCLGYVDDFADRPDLESAGWLQRLDLRQVVHSEAWGRRDGPGWASMEGALAAAGAGGRGAGGEPGAG